MNLALPALIILLGILPGVCFFYGYFAGRFEKHHAGVGGVEEVALYIVFAIPVDALALWVARTSGLDLHFLAVTQLLAGAPLSATDVKTLASFFSQNAYLSAVAYFMALGGGYILGAFARRSVWSLRLDVAIPILKLRHDWFYVLQGRLKGNPRVVLPWADVLTEHPDGSRMYRGLVLNFELGASGVLEYLTLINATRGRGRGEDFQWIPIPSSRLTLIGSKIHSLNLTYMTIENQQRRGPWEKLRIWWRSFVYEEP